MLLLQHLTSAPVVHQQVDYVNAATPSPPVVTAKVMTGAPVTTSGVKIEAPMDLTGLYTVPVKITNLTRTKVQHQSYLACGPHRACLVEWSRHSIDP